MGDTAVYDENGNKVTHVPTGIQAVESSKIQVSGLYDLQGRRLTEKPARGVYILNKRIIMAK